MRRILSVLIGTLFLLTPTLGMADNADWLAPPPYPPPPVEAEHGMAVSSEHYASQVGADILKAGGNAIDAAVAVGYALAVTHPCCGNIGGGGFATIHLANGKDTFIDFREKAPGAASENMYLDAKGNIIPNLSLFGYKAVGVPGSVMGFQKMRTEYGTMSRDQLIAPAIKLAENGFALKLGDVDLLQLGHGIFRQTAQCRRDLPQPWQALSRWARRWCRSSWPPRLREISSKGARRLLQRRYRRTRGRRGQGQWRPSHHEGFRRLYRGGDHAHHLFLSRLSDHLLAAALVRRHHHVRDHEHPVSPIPWTRWSHIPPKACI